MPADSRLPLASSASGRSRNWRSTTVSSYSKTSSPRGGAMAILRPRFAISASNASSAATLNSSPLSAICASSSSLIAENTPAMRTRSCSGVGIVITRHDTPAMMLLSLLAGTRVSPRRRQSGLRLLLSDPFVNARAEHVHWKRSARKHFIVEATQVEFVAQLVLRVLAELENFQLSDFVAKRLRRPRHVSVGLTLHRDFVNRGVCVEIIDHLLPRPVLVVKAGVNHQANRPQHVILQVPVIAVWVLIKANLSAKPLRIKRPAFGVSRIFLVLAEQR